jgi:predicted phosphodiesterase
MSRKPARFLVLALVFALVACGGEGSESDVASDQAVDLAADLGPQTDMVEPAPEVAEPAPDTTEPTPDGIETTPDRVELDEIEPDVAPEVLLPVCEGAWAPVTHDPTVDLTFLRGPFLQQVQGDSAVIAWRLAPPAVGEPEAPPEPGCVRYTVDGAESEVCDDPDDHRQYAVRLTGLPPSTQVTYRAIVGAVETADLRFFAAPTDEAPVRLLVFSDAHVNAETLPQLAAYGLADQVDVAVSVGDHVNSALVEEFDQYFALMRPLFQHVPWWPTIGNHEGRDDQYFDSIEVPGAGPNPGGEAYYSARVGNVWIGVLELKDILVSAMLKKDLGEVIWLREQLASPAAQTATWRLLFLHEPPWTNNWAPCDYNGEVFIRDLMLELMAEGNVTALFSGHTHDYEHGVIDGRHFFIAGGAGGHLDDVCAPLEGFPQPWTALVEHHRLVLDAGCDKLVIEARRMADDAVLDRVEILPNPAP